MKFHHVSEQALLDITAALAQRLKGGIVIYLEGPLGAGKTTFVRGLMRGLGYAGKVKSPTYTLVEPYSVEGLEVYHFDLYRLANAEELEALGIRDYCSDQAICLIEWAEKGAFFLPPADLICRLDMAGDCRDIEIVSHTARGETFLAGLNTLP